MMVPQRTEHDDPSFILFHARPPEPTNRFLLYSE
jgi:hypothetical protein